MLFRSNELVAKSTPDGYTIGICTSSVVINASLYRKLGYDPFKDFAPLALATDTPNVLAVHPSVPVKGVREFIDLAKAKPGQMSYGSSGSGASNHMAMELLKSMAGIDLVHIPYKGAGPALTALLAGEVPLMCTSPLPTLPHIKSGKLKALAMTGRARSRALPDVPTVAESGFAGFQSSLWYALLAPAGTPTAVIQRLNNEVARIVGQPAFSEQLLAQGAEPIGNRPKEVAGFLRADIERWRKVVREAKIRSH